MTQQLTTDQAAELMNVSHEYFLKEIVGKGLLKVQVDSDELMNFKKENRKRSFEILNQLVSEAQELGFYD